jgi:hypothetical protein
MSNLANEAERNATPVAGLDHVADDPAQQRGADVELQKRHDKNRPLLALIVVHLIVSRGLHCPKAALALLSTFDEWQRGNFIIQFVIGLATCDGRPGIAE